MPARHGDFDRSLGMKLSAHVAEVFAASRGAAGRFFLLDMQGSRGAIAVHEVDNFGDGSERMDLDAANNARFASIAGRDQKARNLLLPSENPCC